MKRVVWGDILFVASMAFASTSAANTTSNDMLGGFNENCAQNRHNPMGDLSKLAQAISAEFGGKGGTPANVGGGATDDDWRKSCGQFFDSQGNMGQFGNMVMQSLSPEKHKAMFTASKDLDMICPGFRTMGNEDRKKFWVWTLSATAFKESSCKNSTKSRGPNGTVAGLFQLHQSKENKYPPFTGSQQCKSGDAGNANNSIECTIKMINQYKERAQGLFTTKGKTYWATYRVDAAKQDKDAGTATCARVAQFPGCGGVDAGTAKALCKDAFQKLKGG